VTREDIRPFASDVDVEWSARVMAASEPWVTLGSGLEPSRKALSDTARERSIAIFKGRRAGFLVLDMAGALAGYIQTVCVAPEFRGLGLGTALLRFAEDRVFLDSPNLFLCVSTFNGGARRLYERLGYVPVGELTDYLVAGRAELLMRKTRGPLEGFVPGGR
jgi:ribosomal-protein-alanine N-acetyltransferase